MATYYEFLRVSPGASVAEIEAACETQCNHWRRLATHHDPEMVTRANQALHWLEKVRTTLADPAKREAYDASLGLRGPVGGLADPQAGLGNTMASPLTKPLPKSQELPGVDADQRLDVWVCPRCRAASAVGTQFCKKCGRRLACGCPKCGELVKATAEFCSACGIHLETYVSPPKLQTRLKILGDIPSSKVALARDFEIPEYMMTESVEDALERGIVTRLLAVKRRSKVKLLLSISCDQPVQVQIAADSSWIKLSQISFGLEAEQIQKINVTVDAAGLKKGRSYSGKIAVAARGKTPVNVVHYIWLKIQNGARHPSGSAKADIDLFDKTVFQKVLKPLHEADMQDRARWAKRAAQDHAIRFLRGLQVQGSQSFALHEPAHRLIEKWHQVVSGLPSQGIRAPGPGWRNWNPHVPLGMPVPFRLTKLWTFTPGALMPIEQKSDRRVLVPVDSDLALDALTGTPVRTSQPVPPLPVLDTDGKRNWDTSVISDGDVSFRLDGERVVAEKSGRVLWRSFQMTRKGKWFHNVMPGQHRIYVYYGSEIAVLDKSSGRLMWKDTITAGHDVRFVESNGLLIAFYSLPTKGGTEMYINWWPIAGGQGRARVLGTSKRRHFSYAAAPLEREVAAARVLVAHATEFYDVKLTGDQCQVTERNFGLDPAFQNHLYMRVLGNVCMLFAGESPGKTLHIASIDLDSRADNCRFLFLKRVFPRVFDMSFIGGVLILLPKAGYVQGSILALA